MTTEIARIEADVARLESERARLEAQLANIEQRAVKLRHYIEIARLYEAGKGAEITGYAAVEEPGL